MSQFVAGMNPKSADDDIRGGVEDPEQPPHCICIESKWYCDPEQRSHRICNCNVFGCHFPDHHVKEDYDQEGDYTRDGV